MIRKRWSSVRCAGLLVAAGMVLLAGASATRACMDYRRRPGKLATEAISTDPEKAKAAVAALRAMGPAGLDEVGVLLRDVPHVIRFPVKPKPTHDFRDFQHMTEGEASARYGDRDLHKRILAAVDAVAAQKDAAWSGLYWHTDFDAAKAAARAENKPILSLRLLGRLDEEYSCANSRFFRTVLYANYDVSTALRERFVLHWKSVRPVPKVTIDMGDGRVICRTVTGNSIHYVLDAEGRPVDALPGLYGAKAFLRALGAAEGLERDLRKFASDDAARQAWMAQWHSARLGDIEQAWARDLASVGSFGRGDSVPRNTSKPPTAAAAAPLATAKVAVEASLVRALAPNFTTLEASTDDATWKRIAALPARRDDATLGAGPREMVRAKHKAQSPGARDASRLAPAKQQQEDPILRVISNFERSIAEDTVRNEYGFHRKIHQWFAAGAAETRDVDGLNERVYAELFLTPGSDPWLGLVPEDVYVALEEERK